MKKIILLLTIFLFTACKENINKSVNSDSGCGVGNLQYAILTHDFVRVDFPITNINDDDQNTFMTTLELSSGDTRQLVLDLGKNSCVNLVDLWNFFVDQHAMGDLKISISDDNVAYTQVDYRLAQDVPFLDNKTELYLNYKTRYIKFDFEYYGFGAYGGTPSFYLSELDVIGN